MHKNASISYQQHEGNAIVKTILNIQMQEVVSKRPIKTNQEQEQRHEGEEAGKEPGDPSSVQSAVLQAPSREIDQGKEDFDKAPEVDDAKQNI